MALACWQSSAFMDSCQLMRKESKMEVVHLNQKQLAARWHLSEASLGVVLFSLQFVTIWISTLAWGSP